MVRGMKSFARAILLALVGSVGITSPARASCNAIPDVEMLSTGPPKANPALADFGFKGALGRIDRVYLIPGAMRTMTVVPDGVCVDPSSPRARGAVPPLGPIDDLVAVMYFRLTDAQRSVARVYASPQVCSDLGAHGRLTAGDELPVDVMPECSNDGVRVVTVGTSVHGLSLPLPTPAELEHAFGTSHASPSVRIVVTSAARAETLVPQIVHVANRPCRETCKTLLEAGGVACIDDIFALSPGSGGQPMYALDSVPCNVQLPNSLQANNFAKACENEDSTLPACQPPGTLPDLKMWQDRCGGVHIPFTWVDIRTQSGGVTINRGVKGRSGVGREKPAENPRIWVPWREFLGSTPIADPQGTMPGVSWRRPRINVWYTPEAPEEFGMEGSVDQDDSIVHVFPRLRANLVCSGTGQANACMGIEQETTGGFVTCACADLGAADCTCDPPLVTARYFACGSGPSRGMPCTRDKHCNPGGRCDAKPHCQEPGAVWKGTPDETARDCTVDDDCETEAVKTQCGYRLFNLEDAIENAPPTGPKSGIITLDAKVTGGGPRKRRGGCKTGGAACSNNPSGTPAACAQGDCRGYLLRAGGVAP
jgi:hypothetical protein